MRRRRSAINFASTTAIKQPLRSRHNQIRSVFSPLRARSTAASSLGHDFAVRRCAMISQRRRGDVRSCENQQRDNVSSDIMPTVAFLRRRFAAPTSGTEHSEYELVRKILRAAADSQSTATTVSRLAAEINVDRRRLVEAWLAAAPYPSLRLQDLVGLFVLVRAWELRRGGMSWKEAARLARTSIQRLRAIASRTLGCHLRQIDQTCDAEFCSQIESILLPIARCCTTCDTSKHV